MRRKRKYKKSTGLKEIWKSIKRKKKYKNAKERNAKEYFKEYEKIMKNGKKEIWEYKKYKLGRNFKINLKKTWENEEERNLQRYDGYKIKINPKEICTYLKT